MRLTFVNPAGAVYGSERSMLTLLKASSFEKQVVCPGGGQLAQELEHLGIPVHALEFGKYPLWRNPLWSLEFYRQLSRILQVSSPDAIVINLDGNTPLVTLAALRGGTKIVRFCRFERPEPLRPLDRWCWIQASVIICPSDHVADQMRAWLPAGHRTRVHRLYDSIPPAIVDPSEVAQFRARFASTGVPLIGYVGRIHREKRIEVAIEALAQVRRTAPSARLLIVGAEDGSQDGRAYGQELRQLAERLGLTENVLEAGYLQRDAVPLALAAFDVCVQPSQSESFGMTLVEAWRQGTPTVASDVSGCREITLKSGGGLTTKVGEAAAFAEHITTLIQKPKFASALGLRGQAWAKRNCCPTMYAKAFGECVAQSIGTS